MIFKSH